MARVVLVTGSTDGIGRHTARQLAARGMKVIVHGRSKAKVDATLEALRGELPGAELDGVAFDIGRLSEVRRGAKLILEQAPELDVLLNNAGIFANERVVTEDHVEMTFAVDYLGPWLLTELLAARLEASAGEAPSRVINVSSVAHTRGAIKLDDLQLEHGFTGYTAYAQAKLAQVMHAMTLAERRDAGKLVAYSLHPGVVGTKLLRQGFGPVQGMTAEQGARASIRLAAGEAVDEPSGTYFNEGVATQPSPAARDAGVRRALWEKSVELAKP
jgi:NAD(P)-dependent dehydrogenase (short-subunit alcohol dehydrogenase family)